MKTKSVLKVTVVVVTLLVLSMYFATTGSETLSSSPFAPPASSSTNNSSGAFYLAVDSYGSYTVNLNPFSTAALTPAGYTGLSLVFSPLMYLMNGEPIQPGLATSYSYASNLTSVTFTLRSGVDYSNGQPFNASDVVFSFHFIMSNPAIDVHGLSKIVKSVVAKSSTSVTFNLNNTAYSNLYAIVSQPILYPGQWANITNPSTAIVINPIGTGPYVASSITSSQFVFTWNSHYYFTGSHIPEIIMPSYPNVGAQANALVAGDINWLSGSFDADAPTWATQSANHFYFYPASGFLMLYLNTKMWPFNNSYVRTAIAYAVNRQVLSNESLQPPASNFVMPVLSNYLTSSFLAKYPNGNVYTYNTSYAASLMEKAGFHLSNGKWEAANGTQPSITLSGNGAAANVVANLNEMVTELTNFGFKANTYLPSGAIFYANLFAGNFSAGMGFLADTINPIAGLNTAFNGNYYEPIGTRAVGDYSRFVNASLTQNITLASQQASLSAQQPYIQNALYILINQTPSIPIAESISQNEFNTTGYTGINETSFKDALYSNSYGPVVSIAVPLVGVHAAVAKSTTPATPIIDYVAAIIVVIVVIAGVASYMVSRRKKEKGE